MKLAAALLVTLSALAQGVQDAPEIFGTVLEEGPNIPLPGVEITVSAVADTGNPPEITLLGSVFSDANGAFSFKVPHLGLYRLDAKKAGYKPARNGGGEVSRTSARLTAQRPRFEALPITFMMPGSLTGRVLDEDRQPVVGQNVFVQAATAASLRPAGNMAVTGEDGTFTASGLRPGPYVVRIAPTSVSNLTVLPDSDSEAQIVDSAVESSFWPGGLADPAAVVPIQVQPGSPTNIGTLTLHTAPYYRARVEFRGDCAGEEWRMVLFRLPYVGAGEQNRLVTKPCSNRFLIRDLAPGSYVLDVWTGKENIRWAQVPLLIASENVEASFSLSPSADLTARVVTPSGIAPARLNNLRIELRAEDAPPTGGSYMFTQGAAGQFSIRNIPWLRQAIRIMGVPPTHYIKEIRYAGQPVTDRILSISPGGQIDVVLDDHPATIAGIVQGDISPDLTLVVLDREPRVPGPIILNEPFSYMAPVRLNGAFQFTGLAPGEYRVRAINAVSVIAALEIRMGELTAEGGEVVRVAAGETKSVELRLK